MSPEEKERKDAEMEARGYVRDYVINDGKLEEIWIDPKYRPVPVPKLYDKDGREIRPDFIV